MLDHQTSKLSQSSRQSRFKIRLRSSCSKLLVLGSLIVFLPLAALAAQQAADDTESVTDVGSLEWINEEPAKASKQNKSPATDYGITQQRRGWFELDLQDCALPRKRQAGRAKQLCNSTEGATEIQEYILKFAYMPDDNLGKYPFGIPLDFMLKLDWVVFDEAGSEPFWQIELASYSLESYILMYRRILQAANGENPENRPETIAKGPEDSKGLEEMQEELEIEAYKFLQKYINCLRRGEEICN